MTTSEERKDNAQVKAAERALLINAVSNLKRHGYSNVAIATQLNVTESSVRNILGVKPTVTANLGLATTAELLEELRVRIEVDYHSGGGGLSYTSVSGRPDNKN